MASDGMTVDVMVRAVPDLTAPERERVLAALREAMAADFAAAASDEAERCPHCGCLRIVRRGRDAGRQRWLCRGCGRSFTSATRSILGGSKLPAGKWMAYAECMVDGLTLRDAADGVGVCLKTSFFMRHRVCECMATMLPAFEAGEGCAVEIDETHVRASYTGNHMRSPGFTCPVARGGAVATG